MFAFGTAAGTGAFFTLFCFGAVSGLIRALSDGKRPVRIAGGAGAAVSAALAVWYGMSGGAAPGFVLWKTLLFLLAGMLPWLFFAPAALKGFRLGGAAYRKQPLFLIPAAATAVWLAAVILWNGRLPDGAPAAGFPMLAILMAGGLVRYGEAGDLVYVNTVLRSLVRIFLPLPLLLFLLQAAARFTGKVPPEFVVYGRNENYFMPVLALVVTLVWLRMAEREYRQQLKFVFFCVGIAFLLLAAPGSLPQRMLRGVAPEPFLGMVLESRLDAEPVIVARPGVRAAVAWTLKRDDVRLWTGDGGPEEPAGVPSRPLVVVTDDRRDLAKLSDPKTYFRSGGEALMKYFWLSFLFFVVAYLVPLGGRPLVPPDEFRYAEIPREMMDSGSYAAPHLLTVRYFEKPVLGYWMTAGSFKIFGQNAFALRLPCALGAGLAAFLIFFLVNQTLRDDKLAALASMLFLTSGLVYGVSTFAVLDSQTTGLITGILVTSFLAVLEPGFTRRRVLLLALCGLFAGLAFMTKGFIAWVVPGLAMAGFLIWERRWKEFYLLPWIPAVVALVIVAPWALAVHRAEPDYWNYFVMIEHVQRFTAKTEGQHPEPFWYYIPVLLGGVFPAAFLAPAAFAIGRCTGSVCVRRCCRFCFSLLRAVSSAPTSCPVSRRWRCWERGRSPVISEPATAAAGPSTG